MSEWDIFHCVDCKYTKFSHAPGIFTMDDLFYCFRCENYTDNFIETVELADEHEFYNYIMFDQTD